MEHAFSSSFLSQFFLFAESWLGFIELQGDYTKGRSDPMAHPMDAMDYAICITIILILPLLGILNAIGSFRLEESLFYST